MGLVGGEIEGGLRGGFLGGGRGDESRGKQARPNSISRGRRLSKSCPSKQLLKNDSVPRRAFEAEFSCAGDGEKFSAPATHKPAKVDRFLGIFGFMTMST